MGCFEAVVVHICSGRAFCAGVDLKELGGEASTGRAERMATSRATVLPFAWARPTWPSPRARGNSGRPTGSLRFAARALRALFVVVFD